MISVGIDVSKWKSTICILKPYGEILMSPRDFTHTQSDLKLLVDKLCKYDDEIHITYITILSKNLLTCTINTHTYHYLNKSQTPVHYSLLQYVLHLVP